MSQGKLNILRPYVACEASTCIKTLTVVLVSNDNMHIDIKPYFCLSYRSLLKYRGIRCFPGRDLPNSFARFSISRNVNKYGVSGLAVSES